MLSREIGLWSALAGGLAVLAVLTLIDLFSIRRRRGAARNAIFVLLAGAAVVVLSGLPQALFPAIDGKLLRLLKTAIGPVAASVALYYLGQWIGGMREDPVVHRITTWGSRGMIWASVALIAVAWWLPDHRHSQVLGAAGLATLSAVLLGVGVAARAASQGDPLARWMTAACVLLLFMTIGLYLRGMQVPYLGMLAWTLTAVLTLSYFILAVVLVARRNREVDRLSRLARLDPTIEPATGLPSGVSLVSKVEHAFWLAARRKRRCVVICIYLRNLYELSDTVGQGVVYQIVAAMAARIRRVVGFRCIVGIYHPRCFVVVLEADRQRERLSATLARLRAFLPQPMDVTDTDAQPHPFIPLVGIGVSEAVASEAKALDVLHEAEREAQFGEAVRPEEFIETRQ